ncbi:hypothetical protein AMS68_000513 [Peltaster fructicola]|uniref:Uncharacterized protein n=1 Tax=Peltaster fructicola TaxID=286661 RepID=A0A6H0XJV5_9PEZI|nr:hypothetical protein AMS68_000513 [Peltaster fructicola]
MFLSSAVLDTALKHLPSPARISPATLQNSGTSALSIWMEPCLRSYGQMEDLVNDSRTMLSSKIDTSVSGSSTAYSSLDSDVLSASGMGKASFGQAMTPAAVLLIVLGGTVVYWA